MNVFFHSITAVAITIALTDTSRPKRKSVFMQAFFVFLVGIIFHGLLDYMPHCYPINSKIDVCASLLLIVSFILLANPGFKVIVAASFIGNIFPDLIDLSAAILNKYLHLHLHIFEKIFPWHWPEHSGSLYEGDCTVSNLNHVVIILLALIICISRSKDFKNIFLKSSNKDLP